MHLLMCLDLHEKRSNNKCENSDKILNQLKETKDLTDIMFLLERNHSNLKKIHLLNTLKYVSKMYKKQAPNQNDYQQYLFLDLFRILESLFGMLFNLQIINY